MSRKRMTVTLGYDLVNKIREFSNLWNVKEAEVLRRLFTLGCYFSDELTKNTNLLRREPNGDLVKLEFPGIVTKKEI